jgi:AmmeMemoRadiSam system protein B/AmmeMemoRadiSam system protein A
MGFIRKPAVAGMFYPADPKQLDADVAKFLGEGRAPKGDVPKAIIAPHAGYVYSAPIAAPAYLALKPAAGKITRVILLGPTHRVATQSMAAPTAEAFETPLGTIPIDQEAIDSVIDLPQVERRDDAHAQEHSLEVHLPFLQRTLGDFKLVPFAVGGMPGDKVAEVLERLWGGDETAIVISSDLSHYHDYQSAQALDGAAAASIEALEADGLNREQACGRIPISGLIRCAKKHGMSVKRLDLRNSGDTAGTRDKVVGYGSWAFWEKGKEGAMATGPSITTRGTSGKSPDTPSGEPASDRDIYAPHARQMLQVAIQSINHGLQHGKPPGVNLDSFAAPLRENRGTFVTLKRHGKLHGCIGTIQAHQPLIRDIVENAYKSAFKDPRFPPLQANETEGLSLSISLLSPFSEMTIKDEADLLAQLRPRIDGLIIADQGKRAVFLPQVWDDIPDPKQFLTRLKMKAGLTPDHWSDSFQAYRFTSLSINMAGPQAAAVTENG